MLIFTSIWASLGLASIVFHVHHKNKLGEDMGVFDMDTASNIGAVVMISAIAMLFGGPLFCVTAYREAVLQVHLSKVRKKAKQLRAQLDREDDVVIALVTGELGETSEAVEVCQQYHDRRIKEMEQELHEYSEQLIEEMK